MKGDVIVLEQHHIQASKKIVPLIVEEIKAKKRRYTITVAGESGSGKSETGQAILEELKHHDLKAVLLGQDDYFILPPKSNDLKRREDSEWLGPHIEVNMELLDKHLSEARSGAANIIKPLIDYDENSIEEERIDLAGIDVVIAEGTYTSLLKNIDRRVFIARTRIDTLDHRKKRDRGNEVGDPFIERVLEIEHKIIAGHGLLSDFLITKDYEVIPHLERARQLSQ